MSTDDYDPVKALREEVERFKSTNEFSPMLVTNFYAQAAVVLDMLERVKQERDTWNASFHNANKERQDAVNRVHTLEEFAHDCLDNYDCDADAHKHNRSDTQCRCCKAKKVLGL